MAVGSNLNMAAQLANAEISAFNPAYPFRGRDVGGMNPPLSDISQSDQIVEQMV
jgi:hypothetical protein